MWWRVKLNRGRLFKSMSILPQKIKNGKPHDPKILFLDVIYTKELKAGSERGVHIAIFITASFPVSKR